MGWITTSNTLQYDNGVGIFDVQLVGFSITTTEYLASSYPNLTYAQNVNGEYTFTENVTSLANIIKQVQPYWEVGKITKIPAIRIPLNADYWLWGSSQDPTVVNFVFTSQQYQQAIISIINQLNTTINSTYPIVFILDLHWNFSNGYKNQSANGLEFSDVAQEQPLGVSINTTSFWNSICSVFGIDNNGNENQTNNIPFSIKNNIMFELYNEPYLDIVDDYHTGFNGYVNGFLYNGYYYTGMGVSYLNIRQTNNTSNICILSAAEEYAYFTYDNYVDTTTNKMLNTYNCFTKLNDNIQAGLVTNPNGGFYASQTLNGVIANLHAYSGFFTTTNSNIYAKKYKNPGYGNINNDSNTSIIQIADILLALTTGKTNYGDDVSQFKINFPIMFTEYGQYNLPWGNYSTVPSTNPVDYTLPDKIYPGYYYDKDYNKIVGPALVGMNTDFDNFNISYTLWGCRPNGEWSYDEYYESYEYWNPNQPDTMIGNCNTVDNSTGPLRLLTQEDFAQPTLNNCYTNSCPPNGISSAPPDASGYQTGGTGADFLYLFNNYFLN